MTLQELTEAVQSKAAQNPKLGYRVLFDLGEAGAILWDGTAIPPVITNEVADADSVMRLSPDLLEHILDGTSDPTTAYMLGRLKITGSVGVVMKINAMLES